MCVVLESIYNNSKQYGLFVYADLQVSSYFIIEMKYRKTILFTYLFHCIVDIEHFIRSTDYLLNVLLE